MRRVNLAVLLVAVASVNTAGAQQEPIIELGTTLGVSILDAGGSVTFFGVPGAGLLGQGTLYGTIMAGSSVMVEPQLALNIISSSGSTATTVGIGGNVGFALSGVATNSFYIAGSGAFQSVSGGGSSNSDFAAGGEVGYRIVVKGSLGIRFLGRFRRWFDSELNEITFGVGVGGIVNR